MVAFDEEGKQYAQVAQAAQPGQGRGKNKMQMKRWTSYISETSSFQDKLDGLDLITDRVVFKGRISCW